MTAKLTVIKGGRDIPPADKNAVFISGYITDTRLMGVIGMELTWDVRVHSRIETLHQIFYLDSEEYGIESYTEAYGEDPEPVRSERDRLISALGGNPVPVTEKEARFLLQTYALINKKYHQALPGKREKYSFILKPEETLTQEEYNDLFEKMSRPPSTVYFLINYYLMRCVSGDGEGAACLSADSGFKDPECIHPGELPEYKKSDLFSEKQPSTLCKNTIEKHGAEQDSIYICESLVEYKNVYRLITSEIETDPNTFKVINASKISDFKITSAEASMLMNRSEFISIYDTVFDSEEVRQSFSEFARMYTETNYETGKLYINFNSTNNHVGRPVYRINDDIHTMFYMSDSGQILIVGYDYISVQESEFRMSIAMLDTDIVLTMRYEFKEPVLYEFIKSGFDDFNEFLAFIGGSPEE